MCYFNIQDGRWMGNIVTNVYVKFNYNLLRLDKDLGNLRKSDNNNKNKKNAHSVSGVISVCLQLLGPPRPSLGLCPWTPLGYFCPQFPGFVPSETNFWLRPCSLVKMHGNIGKLKLKELQTPSAH